MRDQTRGRRLDVVLQALEKGFLVEARRDRIENLYHHRSRQAPDRAARPEQAGIERDRNTRNALRNVKMRDAEFIARLGAGRPPRALGKNDELAIIGELDAGALPVSAGGSLVGMITDRDIAVRAVAIGLLPDTPVEDVMTPQVRWCFADDDLGGVLADMGREQIRRMPVLDAGRSLIGIVSLSDIIIETAAVNTAEALNSISEPGGLHSQSDEYGVKPPEA